MIYSKKTLCFSLKLIFTPELKRYAQSILMFWDCSQFESIIKREAQTLKKKTLSIIIVLFSSLS